MFKFLILEVKISSYFQILSIKMTWGVKNADSMDAVLLFESESGESSEKSFVSIRYRYSDRSEKHWFRPCVHKGIVV